MCIVAVLLSLIPVLSGYAIYLAITIVVTEGSPPVQLTSSLIVLTFLLAGSWQLLRRSRARRRRRLLPDEPSGVDQLEQRGGHEGGNQGHKDHHGEERGREYADV